jgi:hypothetical protein
MACATSCATFARAPGVRNHPRDVFTRAADRSPPGPTLPRPGRRSASVPRARIPAYRSAAPRAARKAGLSWPPNPKRKRIDRRQPHSSIPGRAAAAASPSRPASRNPGKEASRASGKVGSRMTPACSCQARSRTNPVSRFTAIPSTWTAPAYRSSVSTAPPQEFREHFLVFARICRAGFLECSPSFSITLRCAAAAGARQGSTPRARSHGRAPTVGGGPRPQGGASHRSAVGGPG